MVGSPTRMLRISTRPPACSTSSLSTLAGPPAPWSWMTSIRLKSPISLQARITRFIFCSISASPRWTALKSSLASFSPCIIDEAAPPPKPTR
jgi:hypothetical protein